MSTIDAVKLWHDDYCYDDLVYDRYHEGILIATGIVELYIKGMILKMLIKDGQDRFEHEYAFDVDDTSATLHMHHILKYRYQTSRLNVCSGPHIISTISTNGPIISRLSKYPMLTYLIQSRISRVSTDAKDNDASK